MYEVHVVVDSAERPYICGTGLVCRGHVVSSLCEGSGEQGVVPKVMYGALPQSIDGVASGENKQSQNFDDDLAVRIMRY
jgi:hypothetical protein